MFVNNVPRKNLASAEILKIEFILCLLDDMTNNRKVTIKIILIFFIDN